MAMSPKAIRELAEKYGIPFLPPGHPEFTAGPQVRFWQYRARQSPKKRLKQPKPVEQEIKPQTSDNES